MAGHEDIDIVIDEQEIEAWREVLNTAKQGGPILAQELKERQKAAVSSGMYRAADGVMSASQAAYEILPDTQLVRLTANGRFNLFDPKTWPEIHDVKVSIDEKIGTDAWTIPLITRMRQKVPKSPIIKTYEANYESDYPTDNERRHLVITEKGRLLYLKSYPFFKGEDDPSMIFNNSPDKPLLVSIIDPESSPQDLQKILEFRNDHHLSFAKTNYDEGLITIERIEAGEMDLGDDFEIGSQMVINGINNKLRGLHILNIRQQVGGIVVSA